MSRARLIRHGRFVTTGVGGVVTPVISAVGLSGIKREGESAWFNVEDDGTAVRYKYDIQVGGSSLTGVTIDDNGSTTTAPFPYVTASSAISFVIPASLVGVNYVANGFASQDAGAVAGSTTWSAPTVADEFFGSTAGTYFTPASRTVPTATRITGTGVTPMQVQLDGAFYDSDQILIYHYNASNTLLEISSVPITEASLGSPFTLDLSGNTDPAPYPDLSAGASTDYYTFRIASGDYAVTDGDVIVSGVASSGVTVPVSDTLTSMVWSGTDKTSGVTITGSNLTATNGGDWDSVRGNRAISVDKSYCEITPNFAATEIGVCDGGVSLPHGTNAYWGSTSFGQVATNRAVGWQGNDSQIYYNNLYTAMGSFSAGDIIQCCFDRLSEQGWWRKNNTGNWNNNPSANPATGVGGFNAPGIDGTQGYYFFAQIANGHAVTANFGTTPGGTSGFAYTPPTGFVAP